MVVERLRAQPEIGQLGHRLVVVDELGAVLGEQAHDLQGRRLAQIADAGLVGDADDRDLRPAHCLGVAVERVGHPLDAEVGHLLVDLAGELHERGGHVVLARLPGQVERVHRQAVAAHPGPGAEGHEAVGLGVGGLDHLPHVDAHPVAEDRQLVDERDVHRPEDVLQQLGELGLLGLGDLHDLVAHLRVELDRAVAAGVGQAADHLGRVAQRPVRAAGIDPLGRERHVEVLPGRQARLLEQRHQALARGAGVGGGLEHHELVLLQDPGQRRGGAHERPEVGLAVLGEGRRHGDDDHLDRRQVRVAAGGVQQAGDRLQALGGDVLDVALAALERGDLALVGVDADDLVALLGDGYRQGEAYVPESDDSRFHGRSV